MPTPGLRQEVGRLRAQGLSFGKIGKELGLSRGYVCKVFKSSEDTQETGVRAFPNQKLRRIKFVAGLIAGKSQKQAALDAGVPGPTAESWGSLALKEPQVNAQFLRLLHRAGLSEDKIAAVHADNLSATKVVSYDAKTDKKVLHPDFIARQKAVDAAWKLNGRMQDAGPSLTQNNFTVALPRSDDTPYQDTEAIDITPEE